MVKLCYLGPVLQHLHRDRQTGACGSGQVKKSVNNRHRQLLSLFLPTKEQLDCGKDLPPYFVYRWLLLLSSLDV
jgi:hypothetical protein